MTYSKLYKYIKLVHTRFHINCFHIFVENIQKKQQFREYEAWLIVCCQKISHSNIIIPLFLIDKN